MLCRMLHCVQILATNRTRSSGENMDVRPCWNGYFRDDGR